MLVSPPSDLAFGAFSDHGPWQIDPERLAWRAGVDALRAARAGRGARAGPAPRAAAAAALRRGGDAARQRAGRLAAARAAHGRRRRRAPDCRAGCAAPSSGSARRTSSSVRSCRRARASSRDELVDEFKRCRDQVPPEPFAVVRRVVEEDLGRPLDERLRVASTRVPRRRVDRAGARGAPAHAARRWSSRCSARASRELVRRDIAGDGVDRAAAGRAHPGRGARQPAGAGRAVRRDHRRGARLPPRSARTCSTSRGCCARPGQTIIVVPRPHPDAGHARACW